VILLLAALLLAPADESLTRARVDFLIGRGRFFDAHVRCILGEALSSTSEERTWYRIRDAYSLWMLGDRDAALADLSAALAASPREQDLLALTSAWLRLKGGEEEGFRRWMDTPGDPDLRRRAILYLDALHGRELREPAALLPLARALAHPPSVSPAMTGLLSALLPGAGHARLGLWSDAALAFTLNAVSIGATVELARARLVFPAIASGLVASLFYVGAIVSSASIARQRNENDRADRIATLDAIVFPELPAAGAVAEGAGDAAAP
jgi:hypothetical protein